MKSIPKILKISPYQLTFKQFLEQVRDESGLSQEDFLNYKIMLPILDLRTFNILKNYSNLSFVLEKRTEEELKDEAYSKELDRIDPNTVNMETELNEFCAKTNITQYYVNYLNEPIELVLYFPYNSNIQFSKFTLEMNNKTVISKVIEKEKAKEKFNDAIASGNVGAMASQDDKDQNIKVNIGNIPKNSIVKLTSEFIQFLKIKDMSYCYTVMKNFPKFSSNKINNTSILYKVIVNIILKTHSKITRLIHKGFTHKINPRFNNDYTQCNIMYFYFNKNKNINKELNFDKFKILFRTESMNKFNLLTQYDQKKK